MAQTTPIEWTNTTWNPVTGCDRISPGCDHCYALTLARRLKAMGQPHYQNDGDPRTSGPGFAVTIHPDTLDLPLRWKTPRRVFVNSMSDLFHPDVPDDFIEGVFSVMSIAHQHTYQILTKRPKRMSRVVQRLWWDCNGDVHLNRFTADEIGAPDDQIAPTNTPNVWLGTSIESDRYTFRADHLRGTPAAVRFLSLEPLLGALPSLNLAGIDWVIVGGESGPGARPMHPDWVRDIRDRCQAAGVAFFFKQWGTFAPPSEFDFAGWDDVAWNETGTTIHPDGRTAGISQWGGDWEMLWKVGKKKAGRLLDGRTWDEYPRGA